MVRYTAHTKQSNSAHRDIRFKLIEGVNGIASKPTEAVSNDPCFDENVANRTEQIEGIFGHSYPLQQ
jgi:hypothetical protein